MQVTTRLNVFLVCSCGFFDPSIIIPVLFSYANPERVTSKATIIQIYAVAELKSMRLKVTIEERYCLLLRLRELHNSRKIRKPA